MKNLSMKAKLVFGVTLALFPAAVSYAADVAIPHAFSAGTPIKSAEVNANFTTLKDSVNTRIQGKAGRLAYAWVNTCTTATCAVNANYAHLSQGGAISVARTAKGRYEVTIPALAAGLPSTTGGTASVTSWGDNTTMCKLTNYGHSSGDYTVKVRCFDPTGADADGGFSFQVML